MKQEFDKVKALNAMLYVANRIGRKDFHKIFKILYFADRQHLADWGRPITGDTYVAMDAGPVPSRIYDMLKIVRGDSYMNDTEGLGEFFKVEQWMYVNPLQDADLSKLSKTERDELDDAINRYGHMPYDEIKEISHDVAWQSTARDFAMKWEDIAREAGLDAEEIDYLRECNQLQTSLN
ncbi:MAG: SocA family protein [Bacteroidales bacterium]|nr:SocA family protein [Bacteroidales bacterium]